MVIIALKNIHFTVPKYPIDVDHVNIEKKQNPLSFLVVKKYLNSLLDWDVGKNYIIMYKTSKNE